MPLPDDDDGDGEDNLEHWVLTQWMRDSPSAEHHPVAYGGKKQPTPSEVYEDVVTVELLTYDAVPKTRTMTEMEHGAMPGIKQPTDGVVGIAEIADAVSA